LGDLDVGGKLILRLVLMKPDFRLWTGIQLTQDKVQL